MLLLGSLLFATRTTAQVTPKKAHEFVGSVGINVKLDRDRYKNNNGFNNIVKPALRDLGARHMRGARFANPTYGAQSKQLWEEYGIRALYVTGSYEGGLTPQGVRDNAKAAAEYLYAVEGQNEPDIFLVEGFGWPFQEYTDRNGNFHKNTSSDYKASRVWHQDMIHYLKNDNATKNIPIATTPMAFGYNVPKIVPIAHDLTSFHHYTHRDPVTTNLNNLINQTRGYAQGGANKPMINSEFGWRTTSTNAVTERTQAKNILTGFCEYFNRGVKISYIHELIDSKWGLIKPNGDRKPSFKALKAMIDVLKEGQFNKSSKKWEFPEFTTRSLDFQLQDKHPTTNRLLLQKSNGEYFLLLWRNADRSNNDGSDISNFEDRLTIKVNRKLSAAAQFKYDNNFNLVKTNLTVNNNAVEALVPDNVLIVKLSVPIKADSRKIEDKAKKKVIAAPNDNNDVPVVQQTWNGAGRQQWRFIYLSDGFYRIENKHNKKVLQAANSNSDGVQVKQRTWNNWNPQKWRLVHRGNGYFSIINKHNNKCLKSDPNNTSGGKITQYAWRGWDSQRWKLPITDPGNRQSFDASLEQADEDSEKLSVYPNPANEQLMVGYSAINRQRATITITDLSGKAVMAVDRELVAGENHWALNITTVPAGAYLLNLNVPAGTVTKKFMITR